ncbi:MAG: hypothetical protein NUV80_01585, partial [Candidatus Berkelbacteria bacterium]|nr:hypothetical protein [Candidatus Berkelbacteria bacterium]
KNASLLNRELATWERQNRTKLSDACSKMSGDFTLVLVSKAHRLQLEMFDLRETARLKEAA